MASRLEQDIQWLKKERSLHKGKWLTVEAVEDYQRRAREIEGAGEQNIGRRRQLCMELMKEYGLLEIEATNILAGYHAMDYVNKYERIFELRPLKIKKDTKIAEEE